LLKRLATRMYFPDEEAANSADPVLALLPPERRSTLVAVQEDGFLRFDIRLQGPGETAFFAV
jgi:protocatechuate 3,4-dioxygenase alpha subunit